MKLKQSISFFLFTLAISLLFSACNNDDDGDIDSPITSEWEFSGYEYDVQVTDPAVKESVVDFLKNSTLSFVGTYTFKEDGTYTKRLTPDCPVGMKYPDDYFIDGTYKIIDGTIYLDESNDSFLFIKDGSLYSYPIHPSDKKYIAECLGVGVNKIVKANTLIVYSKVK